MAGVFRFLAFCPTETVGLYGSVVWVGVRGSRDRDVLWWASFTVEIWGLGATIIFGPWVAWGSSQGIMSAFCSTTFPEPHSRASHIETLLHSALE